MGKLVAACTSATISGEGASEVMSQLAPTSCIQVPILETTVAIQSARNRGRRSGAQADGVGWYTLHARLNVDGKSPCHGRLEPEAIAAEGSPKLCSPQAV